MFEIHMCMCVCVRFVCLFVFFFKSNLSALESKECRLKNQRACRQTNTLKLSRAQRQPNYAKPGGWFIWAHLQSLPILLSLLFSRVPCCKQQARVEENQPAILWNNRRKKASKFADWRSPLTGSSAFGTHRLELSASQEDQVAFEIIGGADHEEKTLASCSTLYLEDHRCGAQCNLGTSGWHLSVNRAWELWWNTSL